MECANENLRSDFERWNQIKTRDFKSILKEMADLHIQLYEKVCKISVLKDWVIQKVIPFFVLSVLGCVGNGFTYCQKPSSLILHSSYNQFTLLVLPSPLRHLLR